MAVDFGEARTGLAMCDRTETLASPLGVIEEKGIAKIVEKIVYAARGYEAAAIVVGLPLNMDGSEGERAARCRKVAAMLSNILTDIPVEMWDERSTTVQASRNLSESGVHGKKRKQVIDAESAAILLDSYMRYRHNRKAD